MGQLAKTLYERPQAGHLIPPPLSSFSSFKEVERDPKTPLDHVHISSLEGTTHVPYLVVQPAPASKSTEIPVRNPHQPPIHSLVQMPKYAKMLKDPFTNKEKFLKLANTPLNENCSATLLKRLHEKLRDLVKFLIPCDFHELEECMTLADQGAKINLMPLSVWKKLVLPELTPTHMTLELANRSVAYLADIAEDVFVQVGKFMFPADFVVIDYDVDHRVPLILGRPFLRTAYALVDVYEEELTLRVGDEKLNYFHEVLNVQKSIHPLSGNPSPTSDPMVVSLSPSLTSFGDNDFLLEETDALLSLNGSIPPEIDDEIFDMEGDILLLEKLLNNDLTKDLPH
nr:reverse transcriptase domain-containing protein [Tanacetum cinerariifolium]